MTPTVNFSCETCMHNEVCAYKDDIIKVGEQIQKVQSDSPFIEANVICSQYRSGKNIR